MKSTEETELQLQHDISSLKRKLESLTRDYEDLELEAVNQEAEIESLRKSNGELRREKSNLDQRLKQYEDDNNFRQDNLLKERKSSGVAWQPLHDQESKDEKHNCEAPGNHRINRELRICVETLEAEAQEKDEKIRELTNKLIQEMQRKPMVEVESNNQTQDDGLKYTNTLGEEIDLAEELVKNKMEIFRLRDEIEIANARSLAAEKELEALQEKMREKSFKRQDSLADELFEEETKEEFLSQIATLRKEIATLQLENSNLAASLCTAQAELDVRRTRTRSGATSPDLARIQELQQTVHELEEKLRRAGGAKMMSINDLRRDCAALKLKEKQARSSESSLRAENHSLQKTIKFLKTQLANTVMRAANNRVKVTPVDSFETVTLREELASAKRDVEKRKLEVSRVESQKDGLQKALSKKTVELMKVRARLSSSELEEEIQSHVQGKPTENHMNNVRLKLANKKIKRLEVALAASKVSMGRIYENEDTVQKDGTMVRVSRAELEQLRAQARAAQLSRGPSSEYELLKRSHSTGPPRHGPGRERLENLQRSNTTSPVLFSQRLPLGNVTEVTPSPTGTGKQRPRISALRAKLAAKKTSLDSNKTDVTPPVSFHEGENELPNRRLFFPTQSLDTSHV
eukprot:m.40469 g.40469  ORF g.40469 m.40469 type:complete len:633 (-) comp9665_c0_seq2:71-1969(-)